MTEIVKDFIKFVAEVIALVVIFSAVFSPEGIATATFNYFVFAEPMMLQNYIASAMTLGSQSKGNFSSFVKVTSGLPHVIRIFLKNGITYVNVIPAQESFLKTSFSTPEPNSVITSCNVPEGEITLQKKLAQTITIEKTQEDGKCEISLTVE